MFVPCSSNDPQAQRMTMMKDLGGGSGGDDTADVEAVPPGKIRPPGVTFEHFEEVLKYVRKTYEMEPNRAKRSQAYKSFI